MDNQQSTSQGLTRSLALRYVIVVTIANVIGSGVYKKVAPMTNELNSSGWVLVAWSIGGLVTLLSVLSYAEVAGLLAGTGGDYAYYKKIYSRFVAFMFGWSSFSIIQTAGISSLAYVFAQSLNSLVQLPPMLTSLSDFSLFGVFYPFEGFSIKFVGMVLIILLSIVNTRSIKSGASISNIILWLIYIGIGIVVVFGLTSSQSNVAQSFDFATTDQSRITISSLFTAMLGAFWAYQGWTTVGFLGGEIKDANRNIPKGLTVGILIIIGIYLLVNVTYLSLLSVDQIKDLHMSGDKIAAIEAVRTFWGDKGAVFISILILITTLGCTHATIYSSPRTYYAMAKEGIFFNFASKLNSAHVPFNAIWLQCIWACLLVLSGSFDQLTDMVIFAVFVYYGLTAAGVFILRKKMPDAHRPYKVWGYPFVPGFVVLFCIGLFLNTIITQPREAIFGTILILTGLPFYWWFNRKNSVRT
ncbi:MAG: amino acid permease [Bacteroidota bacterium]|nr:amino acid permease [Bacteroidota bacterium]